MKKSKEIRVLVVSNMYPDKNSYFGIFVKNQVESLEKLGVNIAKIVKTKRSIFAYMPFISKSILYLLFTSYDLIHAHYGLHSALPFAILKKKPLLITFHRGDALDEPYRNEVYYYLQKFVVSRADHIIAVSKEIKKALINNLNAHPDRISTISYGVDTALFHCMDKVTMRNKLNLSQNKRIILFVGALSYRKGVDIIYKCAKSLRNIDFVLVGQGNLKTDLPNCVFVGPKPHDQVPLWMNAADIFLLPSRSEGSPNVILEACFCGVPVIASAVGGIPNMINDGKNGFIVRTHDPKDYAEAIRELLLNRQKINSIKIKARESVRRNHDNQVIANKIKSIYENLV